jgi:hypothetical protein
MATSPEQPRPENVLPRWLQVLTANPRPVAVANFVLAAGFAGLLVLFIVLYRQQYVRIDVCWGLLALVHLGAGLWVQLRPWGGAAEEPDLMRLLVLTVGSLDGLIFAVMGLLLGIQWWDEVFAGGWDAWRVHAGRVGLFLLALFGGLGLMFVSLQLSRPDAHTNPGRRRLLYGYNAVLFLVLLAAVLGLFNVFAYITKPPFTILSQTYDWTESSLYSLSPESQEVLRRLDKPLHVYVVMPINSLLFNETKTLLDNIEEVTARNDPDKRIDVEYISPDTGSRRRRELAEKYQFTEELGILLVYGDPPDVQQEFVKYNDLFSEDSMPRAEGKPKFTFKGEDALVSKVNYLEEGKTRAVVYFTQGNGEPPLGFSPDAPGGTDGLSDLKGRLERANYEVKELKFVPGGPQKVPADASLVVVVRPTSTLSKEAQQALRDYMSAADAKKRGKLVVLLDVVAPGGTMVQTGLEGLLAEYSVQVGNDRIVSARAVDNEREATEVQVLPGGQGRNPIAQALIRGPLATPLYWNDVRTVRPQPANPNFPGAGRFQAEAVLVVSPNYYVWAETDLAVNPTARVASLMRPDRIPDLERKLSQVPLPVAVAVSEGGGPPPIPGHPPLSQDSQPRLVVFGDADWVGNRALQDRRFGDLYAKVFLSSLSWLRDRPTFTPVAEGKERSFFVVNVKPEVESLLYWLPGQLMVLCIGALALGVWAVRRR